MLRAPGPLLLGTVLLLAQPARVPAQQQAPNPVAMSAEANSAQAHKLLDQMVAALGGERWLTLQTINTEARSASFYHGDPSGGYTPIFTTHQYPDHDRIDLTKKRNVIEIITGRDAWEITYQGRRRVDQKDADDFLRRRDHSIEIAIRDWLKRPGTALFYGGQKMSDRHLADEVTIITANNDSVTLLLDATNHLPRRRVFYWRDPEYHDKNEEAETYDDWHLVDGLPTAFIVTRYLNGDMSRQVYLSKVEYNQPVPPDTFNAEYAAQHLPK